MHTHTHTQTQTHTHTHTHTYMHCAHMPIDRSHAYPSPTYIAHHGHINTARGPLTRSPMTQPHAQQLYTHRRAYTCCTAHTHTHTRAYTHNHNQTYTHAHTHTHTHRGGATRVQRPHLATQTHAHTHVLFFWQWRPRSSFVICRSIAYASC